ncbi:MAG: helix-turn-helix domain-containing protein [Acidobacteria bacterium]|nr:helix-turn-helix domain-containing protein [Acidobacteriota bacterium]
MTVVSDEPTGPPEVMRRKVRNIIRHERERRGITQKAAAERVLWSQSKLVRLETGVTPPAPADVRLLLMEYGADEERVAEIVEIAKAARQPDEWETYKNAYSNVSINLFANERAATLIQKFEPTLVPGLFQTEEYARALLRETRSDPDKIDDKVRARLHRQEILDREDCPDIDFIIGEASVSRPIGGDSVMRAQIENLKKIAKHKKVALRLMPFSKGAHPGLGSAFTILEFKDPDLPDLVYLESADHESIVRDDQAEVDRYNRRFAELLDLADPPEDLPATLDEIAKQRFSSF